MRFVLLLFSIYAASIHAEPISYCVNGRCEVSSEKLRRLKMEIDYDVIHSCIDNDYYALTFDDEPSANTEKLLRILDKNNVKASFFVNTSKLIKTTKAYEKNIVLLRKILDAGHEINNHTVNHKDLTKLSPNDVRYEIAQARETLDDLLGGYRIQLRSDIVRPPFGYLSNGVFEALNQLSTNYIFVRWNADRYDWESGRTSEQILSRVSQQFSFINRMSIEIADFDRSILDLNHGWSDATIASLETHIEMIKKEGYRFVTTSACIGK